MPITRRGVLGGALGAGAALMSGEALSADMTGKAPRQPNILYIMADDMGYGDLGCTGKAYDTPNIDRIAAEGLRLTQAYANSCVCTATRVGLITGRYQNRLRIGQEEPLAANSDKIGLEPSVPTMPRYMKQLGYRTVLVGKWHMGDGPRFGPLKSGYDRFFGLYAGGKDYFIQPKDGSAALRDGDQILASHRYLTDELGDRAVREIREAKTDDAPLFLSLHFTAPHWPWEGPEDMKVAEALSNIMHHDGGSIATFQKMLTSLDVNVGKVLQALADTGQMEDTIVVFTSDNGGERFSNVWPFTGMKGELLEGGLRVPALIRWPGRIKPGSQCDQVAISMDWMPTFLAAAGAPAAFTAPTDGMDILPHLFGAPSVPRKLFWMYKANNQAAHRDGDWKYLRLGAYEHLFNIVEDAHERADLSKRESARFEAMKKAHADWTATMLPYPKDSYSWDIHGQVPDRY
ncbi:sulfatase family protein [Sphingobium nicotianae]|uniref:Sulfatase-like hydrolase/transferase n=1 Tax=Sphingobium nicotianae TaxID=2782607 RepID=A0A9X1AIC3_9SPHN|nr:sulfatase-like hydrolase/transferase [Sphingobium nicotianae]MBT2185782.1 sulfatase-like hydrolase/transferase [Sphingobium nicotianae]